MWTEMQQLIENSQHDDRKKTDPAGIVHAHYEEARAISQNGRAIIYRQGDKVFVKNAANTSENMTVMAEIIAVYYSGRRVA
jgi:hypothetical protein